MAVSAVMALWCLFALASGDVRALCLDLGGGCSAMVPEEPCHDQAPYSGTDAGCTSCVDVLVPEDAAASGGRPDHELRGAAAAHPFGCASPALPVSEQSLTATAASLIGSPAPHPCSRTVLLRI